MNHVRYIADSTFEGSTRVTRRSQPPLTIATLVLRHTIILIIISDLQRLCVLPSEGVSFESPWLLNFQELNTVCEVLEDLQKTTYLMFRRSRRADQ